MRLRTKAVQSKQEKAQAKAKDKTVFENIILDGLFSSAVAPEGHNTW
jgi:hypothetical protein